MKQIEYRLSILLALLALAAMMGCQGVSVGSKSAAQSPPPAAQLSAGQSTVTFNGVQSGKSQTQSDTLTNTGGASLTITQASVSGTGFSMSGLSMPVTLAAGQSTSFNVTFAPKSTGSFSGSIAITSDAADPNVTVTLSGSASAVPVGQLSVGTVGVGNVTVGKTGTKNGTLSATGASVVVTAVNIGGTNPAEFSISGLAFPVTVNTNQPVNFTVTFAPQASGAASADASFTSNASNSADASLSGTGVSATVHSVSLSWNASTSQNVVSYNVYRAAYTSGCGSYTKIGSSANTTFMDTSVVNGNAYCYETTAVNSSDQESTNSTALQNVAIPSS